MPATRSPNSANILYGWQAALWATTSMSDSLSRFIGGLANFIILLILLFRIIIPLQKRELPKIIRSPIAHALSTTVAILSIGSWLVTWSPPLFVGYYIWAISIIGLCLTNWLFQRSQNSYELNLQKEDNIINHLVED